MAFLRLLGLALVLQSAFSQNMTVYSPRNTNASVVNASAANVSATNAAGANAAPKNKTASNAASSPAPTNSAATNAAGSPAPKNSAVTNAASSPSPKNTAVTKQAPAPNAAAPVFPPKASYATAEWIDGRATYYGASKTIADAYRKRGIGSFGIIEYGSCGFTNSNGVLPYPRDQYAALADANFDYAGSCGRCYEVKCRNGLVYDQGKPVKTSQFYYLAGVDRTPKDDYGRSFPGA